MRMPPEEVPVPIPAGVCEHVTPGAVLFAVPVPVRVTVERDPMSVESRLSVLFLRIRTIQR